ncbi:hypothetical protein KIN20_018735 [Parelaphostrongylus tenuis]|uniref:Uncharacterized protein n=1 Tax=Parelaphostrongylus tenuis TaxID=148309 RepID=A0AAD5N7V8_PARTN|nr:hypothetical protein KIN20_018735 [Parelaphostrongylus tenuis]
MKGNTLTTHGQRNDMKIKAFEAIIVLVLTKKKPAYSPQEKMKQVPHTKLGREIMEVQQNVVIVRNTSLFESLPWSLWSRWSSADCCSFIHYKRVASQTGYNLYLNLARIA